MVEATGFSTLYCKVKGKESKEKAGYNDKNNYFPDVPVAQASRLAGTY